MQLHHVRTLVVGCGAYREASLALPNPQKDAQALAVLLREAGAEVQLVLDPTRVQLSEAVMSFADPGHRPMPQHDATRGIAVRLRQRPAPTHADKVVGLLFFAGHGLEVDGENMLVPSDFELPGEELPEAKVKVITKSRCLVMSDTMAKIRDSGFYVSLVLLDCCRNWPFRDGKRSLGGKRGLGDANVSALSHEDNIGAMVGYAAAAGAAAKDASSRMPGHSPYTAALLQHLAQPGLQLDMTLGLVTDFVRDDTGGQQTPAEYRNAWGVAARELVLFPAS